MVRNPVRVVKLSWWDCEDEVGRSRVTLMLYNWGVPRLCGYQRCGMKSGILRVALTNVGDRVEAGRDLMGIRAEVTLSSGIEMVIDGDLAATAERIAIVTFRTQSAASFGRAIGVCPTFAISSECSSMKSGPVEDTRRGCDAGVACCSTSDNVTR